MQEVTNTLPVWTRGIRVRLVRTGHPKDGHLSTVLGPLPNPSGRRENQWYDVRFDDGVYGRFMEKYLERDQTDTLAGTDQQNAISQTSKAS